MPSALTEILNQQLFGNTAGEYLLALLIYLAALFALRITQFVIVARIKKMMGLESRGFASFLILHIEKIVIPTLYFAAFYFAFSPLLHFAPIARVFKATWIIVLSFQSTKLILALLSYFLEEFWITRAPKTADNAIAFKSLLNILRLGVWAVALVFVLDNLGFNVGAVVAGLGIGGVAVALAAQTILGDLFNYFVIFFDRPFEEGDFIIFEDYMGVIENIGIKSTRIRSLSGEQIVISNSNLTSAKIRNYKRMIQRRVVFTLGVVYETSLEKIKKIPEILKQIVQNTPETKFDRAHFKDYGSYSLNFEVVYFALTSDYNKYMDMQQTINWAIMEAFQKESIEFAYPTSVQYEFQKRMD